MAVFSDGGVSSPDIYIGVFCICVALIGTLLNFLVFRRIYQRDSSVPRNLYLALSTADLLTVTVLLGSYSVRVLMMKEEECRNSEETFCNELYYIRPRVANLGERIFAIFSWTIILAPYQITAVLATTRFYQIKYPLHPLRGRKTMLALLITMLFNLVVVSWAMLDVRETDHEKPVTLPSLGYSWHTRPRVLGFQMSWLAFDLMVISLTVIFQVGAMVASILTVFELVKAHLQPASARKHDSRTRSSARILITNLGSFILISAICFMFLNTKYDNSVTTVADAVTDLIISTILPALLSAINPVIYIIFTCKCGHAIGRVNTSSSARWNVKLQRTCSCDGGDFRLRVWSQAKCRTYKSTTIQSSRVKTGYWLTTGYPIGSELISCLANFREKLQTFGISQERGGQNVTRSGKVPAKSSRYYFDMFAAAAHISGISFDTRVRFHDMAVFWLYCV